MRRLRHTFALHVMLTAIAAATKPLSQTDNADPYLWALGVSVLMGLALGYFAVWLVLRQTRRLAKEKFGDETRWRDVMAGLPMRRAATTDEVSGMVAFLASDRASYISGSSILIDGGLLTDSANGVKRG